MSDVLHGLALRSALSANLRLTLMALCDAAGEDDGSHCNPSIEYVAYKTGFSVRHAQRIVRTLEAAGYIEPVAFIGGGRGHATHYHIHIDRVPMRRPWKEVKAELIAQGKYADDERPLNADEQRSHKRKGDILSPISETPVKGDKMSPIAPVKGDILSPIAPVKGDILSPDNPYSSSSIPNGVDDPYALARDLSSSIHQDERTTREPEPDTLTPPSPPLSLTAIWHTATRSLQRGLSAHGVLSASEWQNWIEPVRLYNMQAVPEMNEWTFTLYAPGSYAAEMLSARYQDALTYALAKAAHLRPEQVILRIIPARAALKEVK